MSHQYSSRVRASIFSRPSLRVSDYFNSVRLTTKRSSIFFRGSSGDDVQGSCFQDMSLSRYHGEYDNDDNEKEQDEFYQKILRVDSKDTTTTATQIGEFWNDRVAIFQHNVDTIMDIITNTDSISEEDEDEYDYDDDNDNDRDNNPQDNDDGPFSTFKKNVGTLTRRFSGNSATMNADAAKNNNNLIDPDHYYDADHAMDGSYYGNPQHDDSRHGPLDTFRRNMDTIARRVSFSSSFSPSSSVSGYSYSDDSLHGSLHGSVSDFVMARMDTFTKNVNFAQATAEGMARDLGTMDTFSRNINFAQSQVESLTRDIGASVMRRRGSDGQILINNNTNTNNPQEMSLPNFNYNCSSPSPVQENQPSSSS